MVYEIDSLSGVNGEWSLDGGSITTDGTIGDITFEKFIEWSIQFSSPLGQYEISSDNGAALLVTEWLVSPFGLTNDSWPIEPPSLKASSHKIYASFGNVHGTMELYFASEDITLDTFSGQAVGFFPSTYSGLIHSGSGVVGSNFAVVDNQMDDSVPYRPFKSDINANVLPGPGQVPDANPNFSIVGVYSGSMVLASVRLVPEPTTSIFLLLPSLGFFILKRRGRLDANQRSTDEINGDGGNGTSLTEW